LRPLPDSDQAVGSRGRVLLVGAGRAIQDVQAALAPTFDVQVEASPATARARLEKVRPDAVVMDADLVDETGRELWSTLWRGRRRRRPTLLVTRYRAGAEAARAFRGRADDYLVEPFAPSEALYRVSKLMVGRSNGSAPGPRRVGDLVIDTSSGTVSRGGEQLFLPPAQLAVLVALASRPDKVWTADEIARAARLHVRSAELPDQAVRVAISRLRRGIEANPARPRYLHTVRGRGYILRPGTPTDA
jgi:two-component system phosphate regulon response regulator OmpR